MVNKMSSDNKNSAKSSNPKTILVADDDPGIQDIFLIILQQAGYVVDLKKDGDDLLKKKFKIPDLFLIDKQLSGSSGLDICRQLKADPKTRNIPTILMSASPDIARLSREVGADAHLEKPFDLNAVLKLIERYI